jgi:hypothetical protein
MNLFGLNKDKRRRTMEFQPGDSDPKALNDSQIETLGETPTVPMVVSAPTARPEDSQIQTLGETPAAPMVVAPPVQTPDTPLIEPQLSPMSVPAPLTPLQQAEMDVRDTMNKDYSIKTDENGNVIRGADRDKTFNWKDVLRSVGLGALKGMATGDLGGAIGGAIAGGVRGSIDRNFDNKLQDQMFVLPSQIARLEQERKTQQFNNQNSLQQAQIDAAVQAPIINRMKAETDAAYKAGTLSFKDKQLSGINQYRNAIVELRKQGVAQNDVRIQILERKQKEVERSNEEKEKDRDFDREARIDVAKIMANNQMEIAKMREQGTNQRFQFNLEQQKQQHDDLMRQRDAARQSGDKATADRLDLVLKNAQINGQKAVQSGAMTQEQFDAMFGAQ